MKHLVISIIVVSSAARAEAPPEALTLQRAVDLSLGRNADLAVAREAVAGAEARASGVKAHRFATLHLNASGNLWREPYSLDFGGNSFVLHERTTSATVVTIAQPLSGLAYLSELVDAADRETSVSRHDYDRVRLDTAYHTAEMYVHALQARASAEVAHHSVTDIDGEVARAKQLRAADTYTDIDVLRFQSAKAAADQTALRADTAMQLALAELTVQLGLTDGTPIDITDDLPAAPPPLAMTLERAQTRAIDARPELHAARDKIAAAEDEHHAAQMKYFPDVRAVGVWQHLTGVQPFQPENEEYVGVTVSWNVWDWGATHQAVLEAERTRSKASLTARALAEKVKLEVRRRWLEAKTSYDSLAVAETQQQTAEEAFRLQKVKLDNAAATATDVLDAETDVARARLGFAGARYDYYVALVALARSVGDLPNPR